MNAKYSTKNNITDDNPVFLATKNHIRAIISSARNFKLTEINRCIVWPAGSFFWPLKKITSINIVSSIKEIDRRVIPPKKMPLLKAEVITNPETSISISSKIRYKIYLSKGFNRKFTSENL